MIVLPKGRHAGGGVMKLRHISLLWSTGLWIGLALCGLASLRLEIGIFCDFR
jgi:hypothetical protein